MKLILALAFLFELASAAENGGVELRFRPFNRIFQSSKVSLLDLVDKDSLSREQQQVLSVISLGDAPKLGEQRIYSSQVIAEAVRGHLKAGETNIQIPHRVIVQNRGYELDPATVEAELISFWQTICADCRLKINSLKLPTLPPSLKDRPWRYETASQLPRGPFSQKLIFQSVDGQELYYWINGEVEISKRVPVLIRSTPMLTRFQPDDFKFEWRDVTRATDTTPTETEIIGQQARFTMNANDIIWRNSIVREKAVQRGEIVKVMIGDEKWQISTQAITQQDGFVGDTIVLKNLQTQKIITGRVVGAGEVELR